MSGSSSNDKDKNVLVNTLFMFQPREECFARPFFFSCGSVCSPVHGIGLRERDQWKQTRIATPSCSCRSAAGFALGHVTVS